jgi:hypothetical protein
MGLSKVQTILSPYLFLVCLHLEKEKDYPPWATYLGNGWGALLCCLGNEMLFIDVPFLPFLGNITIFLGQHWLTFLEQHNQYSPIIFWSGNVFISEVLPK